DFSPAVPSCADALARACRGRSPLPKIARRVVARFAADRHRDQALGVPAAVGSGNRGNAETGRHAGAADAAETSPAATAGEAERKIERESRRPRAGAGRNAASARQGGKGGSLGVQDRIL